MPRMCTSSELLRGKKRKLLSLISQKRSRCLTAFFDKIADVKGSDKIYEKKGVKAINNTHNTAQLFLCNYVRHTFACLADELGRRA